MPTITQFTGPLFLERKPKQSALVDASPVRAHLEQLDRDGVSYRSVAKTTGLNDAALRYIRYGNDGRFPMRVPRTTAQLVLGVHPAVAVVPFVPSRGTQRRIQALMVCGWSMSKLAALTGMSVTNFKLILHRDQVRPPTRDAVAAVYEELWDQAPPRLTNNDKGSAQKATRRALAAGWMPPLAWDDIDTDPTPPNPADDRPELAAVAAFMAGTYDEDTLEQEIFNLHVDWVAVERACDGHPTTLGFYDRRAAITRLHGRYLSDGAIAQILHLNVRVVYRTRKELGLPARVNADQTLVTA